MENSVRINGIVTRKAYTIYDVFADGETYHCHLPGRLLEKAGRLKSSLVVVGDHVDFLITDPVEKTGIIEEISVRETQLSRSSPRDKGNYTEQVIVSNVSQMIIVASPKQPETKPGLIDRYLASAEHVEIKPLICLNKIDLVEEQVARDILEPYLNLGYACLSTSAKLGIGIDEFRLKLKDHTSVLAGQSGVGKSSLLNAVQPGLKLKTGEISTWSNKGRHTTSAVSLMPLIEGGFVVDTPGIREFGLWDVTRENLAFTFCEFRPLLDNCKFLPCTHIHEPNCAIKAAVESGAISNARYESYCRILESLSPTGWSG